jgi:5-methylcytosine-specific restriction protein A
LVLLTQGFDHLQTVVFFIRSMKTLKPQIKTINTSLVKAGGVTERIRGNSLVAIKRKFEQANPRICATCIRQGLVGYGDELEHITPLWQGGAESDLNREWICTQHHKAKTATEAGQRAGFGI